MRKCLISLASEGIEGETPISTYTRARLYVVYVRSPSIPSIFNKTKGFSIMSIPNSPLDTDHSFDATAPTVTFDDPPDLTPRPPEAAYVIIRVNLAGDIESTTVEDGFYYVEFLAYDVAQLLAREQPGWRFFVAVIPDPGASRSARLANSRNSVRPKTREIPGEPAKLATFHPRAGKK